MSFVTDSHQEQRTIPTRAELEHLGISVGLTAVGVCSPEPFVDTEDILVERKAAGLHGGMNFTYRNPARSTDPKRILSDAQAIIVGAFRYDSTIDEEPSSLNARVARYATDLHYEQLRASLEVIARHLESQGWTAKVVLDSNALVDRAAAVRAGLGFYGKNTNVLLPRKGSWYILGSVITNAPIEWSPQETYRGCGTCSRCLDDCPTGALVSPGVLDARRCLAWLVQQGGDFPHEYRRALGDRIYGCDVCQEVCPPTIRSDHITSQSPELNNVSSTFTGPGSWVDIIELLRLGDDDLLERFGAWYIPERNVQYLRRNALVILGNVLATQPFVTNQDLDAAKELLSSYVSGSNDMLARHAAWAILRSGIAELVERFAHLAVIQSEQQLWVNDFHHTADVAQTEQVTPVTVSISKAPAT